MFDALRALPPGPIAEPVAVRVVNDLYWSDGHTKHLHATIGQRGFITHRTNAGFLVRLSNGQTRQVLDFQGEKKAYRIEDEFRPV